MSHHDHGDKVLHEHQFSLTPMTSHALTITEDPYNCLNVSCICGFTKRFGYNVPVSIPSTLSQHDDIEDVHVHMARLDVVEAEYREESLENESLKQHES